MAATAAGRSGRGAKLPVVPGTVPANATGAGGDGGLFSGMFNRGQWIQYMWIKIQSTESSSAGFCILSESRGKLGLAGSISKIG